MYFPDETDVLVSGTISIKIILAQSDPKMFNFRPKMVNSTKECSIRGPWHGESVYPEIESDFFFQKGRLKKVMPKGSTNNVSVWHLGHKFF